MNIPPEALEAGARKVHEHGQHAHIAWRDLSDFDRECLRDVSHDCFLAMIEAWPGAYGVSGDPYRADDTEYRLPITENPNADKA